VKPDSVQKGIRPYRLHEMQAQMWPERWSQESIQARVMSTKMIGIDMDRKVDDTAGAHQAAYFAEDSPRIIEMLENGLREDDIEGAVLKMRMRRVHAQHR